MKFIFLAFITFTFCRFCLFSQCYTCFELKDNRYDKTAFLTTHNSFNCEEGNFQMPNQTYSISTQLNDGVRALMIDVYEKNGVPTVYHGFSLLGSVPLASNLAEIKDFLVNNPTEIVTLILECNVSADMIEQAIIDAQLFDYLFEKNEFQPWPTLNEMINENQRLVVFTDQDDASEQQKWYHYMWIHAVETHFTVHDIDEFTCDYNRGEPDNDLFIFNHFITSSVGTGNLDQAAIANSNPFFIDRINSCIAEKEKLPNFVTVDFYETGNCCDVVNLLNDLYVKKDVANNTQFLLYPQPAQNHIIISTNGITDIILFDINGSIVKHLRDIKSDEIILNIDDLIQGIYFIQVNSFFNRSWSKIVKL